MSYRDNTAVPGGRPMSLTRSVALAAALLYLLLPAVIATDALARDGRGAGDDTGFTVAKACTATGKAARRACINEARDDYWIGVGNCANLSDPLARFECFEDVVVELDEAKALRGEQFEARFDLCDAIGEAPYDPVLDPADFLTADQLRAAADPNPYLPLVPGTTYRYVGGDETIEVAVTDEVKVIFGIPALVVRDVARVSGEVIEDTLDWYAQDLDGNVWYLGEISQEFEDGELVSLEGSWKAYRDSAKPGIIMPAAPRIGDVYRQEFALGNAEDAAEVVDLAGSASAPAAACDRDCLVTRDFTPISPDAIEFKHYAPGVGLILEVDPETGDKVELVGITPQFRSRFPASPPPKPPQSRGSALISRLNPPSPLMGEGREGVNRPVARAVP